MGAFDSFGKTRSTLLSTIDEVIDRVSNVEQDEFLFNMLTPKQSHEDKEELFIKSLVLMKRILRILYF